VYQIKITTIFTKDVKRAQKHNKDMLLLKNVIKTIEQGKSLSSKQRDHNLSGNWQGYRECHIQPDWLLIYRIVDGFLVLERTGSHSDLF
jgi:mRNA interferase YafQ